MDEKIVPKLILSKTDREMWIKINELYLRVFERSRSRILQNFHTYKYVGNGIGHHVAYLENFLQELDNKGEKNQ